LPHIRTPTKPSRHHIEHDGEITIRPLVIVKIRCMSSQNSRAD
jgi:hypothetical protein